MSESMENVPAVVIYARSAYVQQNGHCQQLESQVQACMKYCLQRGWYSFHVHAEVGKSG